MDDENLPLTDAEDAEAGAQSEQENTETPEEPKAPPHKKRRADPDASEGGGKTKKRANSALRRVLAGILTLLLIALAVLVFVFRDELTGANLRRALGMEEAAAAREAFTYETGANQVFAPAGDGLAVASGSSVQLLSAAGETVFKQVISYDTPAVFASEKGALFCDLGGTGCILADFAGVEHTPEHSGEIQTAGMNENGWFYLVTAEAGYKGLVSVYNAAGEKQYEWWSGSGYVLRAAISPDNRSLAVLCAEREGAKLHFFAMNSEEERAAVTVADTLLIDLCWLGSDSVCAVGEAGVWFYSADGTEKSVYALDGRYLLDYEFGRTGFMAVFVSAYRSGAGGTLLTLDARGQVLGSAELDRDVISLSAVGKQLLAMTGDTLALYSQDMVRQSANETLMTAKRAILRPAGDILLLHAYSAEKFSF